MTRLGITGKLVFHSAWILVALGTGVTLYFVRQLRELRYQDTVRRVEAQALNWIEANQQIFFLVDVPDTKPRNEQENNYDVLDAKIDELAKKEWIAYVILLDSSARIRATTAIPEGLIEEGPAPEVSGVKSRVTSMKDSEHLLYFELATPLSVSGTGMNPGLGEMFRIPAKRSALGEVRIGVDRRQFERHLAALMWQTISLSAALVLLAAIASFVFARRIVEPIAVMARVANEIARGNLSSRLKLGLERKDEVGDLVRNFDHMAERLESLHSGLEDKVRQRTSDLEDANKKLQELNKLKSYFVSVVSHDLRTPLTSIKAFAEILLDKRNPDPERQKHYLEIINKESDRMTRLISDLLSLEKINSGTFDWTMGSTDLQEIIQESQELLRPLSVEKDVELYLAESDSLSVWADPDCLRRVVTNLIGNAIKFSHRHRRVEIQVGAVSVSGPRNSWQGDYARVSISDHGPGIPREEHERVFDAFYQGPKHTWVGSSVGIGLTICKEIVSHHKGEIWVESEPGTGSRFTFTVPLSQSPLFLHRAYQPGS